MTNRKRLVAELKIPGQRLHLQGDVHKSTGGSCSPPPVLRFHAIYFPSQARTFSHRRMRMVATWDRTAEPAGRRVVPVTPVISPSALAHARASLA